MLRCDECYMSGATELCENCVEFTRQARMCEVPTCRAEAIVSVTLASRGRKTTERLCYLHHDQPIDALLTGVFPVGSTIHLTVLKQGA